MSAIPKDTIVKILDDLAQQAAAYYKASTDPTAASVPGFVAAIHGILEDGRLKISIAPDRICTGTFHPVSKNQLHELMFSQIASGQVLGFMTMCEASGLVIKSDGGDSQRAATLMKAGVPMREVAETIGRKVGDMVIANIHLASGAIARVQALGEGGLVGDAQWLGLEPGSDEVVTGGLTMQDYLKRGSAAKAATAAHGGHTH